MKILDLFCGAGGAAMGYHRAHPDAEIVGIDIEPQPDYPFEFHQADALEVLLHSRQWDDWFVHASPPCQSYSTMTNRHASSEARLIHDVRSLIPDGVPYAIENVVGARREMFANLMLCGSMFRLPTRRHRIFECSFMVWQPDCGDHTGHIPVYGRPDGRHLFGDLHAWDSIEAGQQALGIDWTTNWHSLREAIPPAYTEYIGSHL